MAYEEGNKVFGERKELFINDYMYGSHYYGITVAITLPMPDDLMQIVAQDFVGEVLYYKVTPTEIVYDVYISAPEPEYVTVSEYKDLVYAVYELIFSMTYPDIHVADVKVYEIYPYQIWPLLLIGVGIAGGAYYLYRGGMI